MVQVPAGEAATLRPLLKWAGGKRWLLPYLRPLWASHRGRRLVEPLCGGLAVALGLLPERALINDINPHLINFYRWLQRGLRTDLEMRNDATLFYAHREHFNSLIRSEQAISAEAAALFYYLNRTGFNGLCRFNRRGEFNVPFGSYRRIRYTSDFTPYRDVFAGWELTSGPNEALRLEADDFIYADPPYDVPFTSYAKEGFSWDDQVRLVTWLARHPGPVVLSNQATARICELYMELGFEITILQAPRRISRTGDRTPAAEVLALRNIVRPIAATPAAMSLPLRV